MRIESARSMIDVETDAETDLLTTGEAARLLNSSRQHVVDLCNRGDLPYVTVGTHRRVLRTDVEAVRDRALRMTRDQRRSFWIAFALAGRIVEEPERARERARRNIKTMRTSARGGAVVLLDEWERLLDGPVEDLVTALTSRSPRSRELRQNSPFAGLLSADERNRVLEAWSSAEQRKAKG